MAPRQVPSTCFPSTRAGPVHPLGVRITITGPARPLATAVAGAVLNGADLGEALIPATAAAAPRIF